jgi:hypothetical protein
VPPGVTTLATIRTTCQQRSDNVNSTFIATSEWNGWINSSYQELYGLIVQAFGNDYFVQSPSTGYTFTTDGTNQFFALPSDFFKLLGVDLQVSAPNYWVSLKQFTFQERNKLSLTNNTIPQAGQTIRVLYVPRLTILVSDSDTVDGVNGWEEYIVADVCEKAAIKEESYEMAQMFAGIKAELKARLDSEVENRDAATPATIADSYGRRSRAMQYRLNGSNLWLIGNGMPGWGPLGDWGADMDYGGGWF